MSELHPPLRAFRYEEISAGQRESFCYEITPAVFQNFLDAFQDFNPVHVDEGYARARGFPGPVVHGAVLNGFISHFVGSWFPGRCCLELAVEVRFANPCHLGDRIRLDAVVSQKMDAKKILILDATLNNLTQNKPAARSRIQVMLYEPI